MAKNKKKMNKYIATAATAAVLVAPVAAVPTEAASVTGAAVTTDINGLIEQAAATEAFYKAVEDVRKSYTALSSTQKSKVTAATLTKLVNSEKAVQVMKDIQALVLTDVALESKAAAIRTAYTAIPLAGKLQVKNLADLVKAEEAAVTNKANAAAAAKVTTQINALGTTPTELAVTNARAAYDKLTDVQKPFVTTETVTKLTTAETNITNKKTAATNATTKATTYIENVGEIATAADRNTAISTAEAGYLTAEELALLTTEKAAEVATAKKSFDNLKAAQEVAKKIAELALTDDFEAYEAAVKEARELYAKLPLAQKLLVNNLADLVEEEKTVALGEEKAQETVNPDTVAAKKVTALIEALPAVADAKATDEAAVLAASAAFEALTTAGKALVTAELQGKLTGLVNAPVFATAKAVAAFETKVSAIKDKTAANVQAAIDALATDHAVLSDDAKAAVLAAGNYKKVLDAHAVFGTIKTAVEAITVDAEAAEAQLAALLGAKTTLDALAADVQVFVRNQAVLTSKINAVTSALRTAATSDLTALASAANHVDLGTAITKAEGTIANYAIILGVANFATASVEEKLKVTSTLTKYVELENAKAGYAVGELVKDVTLFVADTKNFSEAISSNNSVRAKYTELTTKQTPYVKNYTTLTGNESAVTDAFGTLTTTANNAIVALSADSVTSATLLNDAITATTTPVNEYKNVYLLLNTDKAEADAYAALTNHGDIALATAAKDVITAVEGLTYTYTANAAVVKADLATAIEKYKAVTVTTEMASNKFYDKLGKTKYANAATAITDSIAKLAADVVTAITALKPDPAALPTVIAYEGLIGDAETAVADFATPYKAYHGVETADYTAVTNYGDLAKAEAAVATIRLYDALAYTAPALDAYDFTTFKAAVDALKSAKDSLAALTAATPGAEAFVFNTAKATTQESAINATLALLKGDTETEIAAIKAENAATAAAMTTVIGTANDAYTAYDTAFKAVNGPTADDSANVALYGNIALAEKAQPVMKAFEDLVYTEETAAAYNIALLTNAVGAYNTALESYNGIGTAAQAFVFNKVAEFDAIATEFGKTLANLDADAEGKIAAIETATADVDTLQTAINTAKTAADTKFAAAYKLVKGSDAVLAIEITDYANIAAAEAAIEVVKTIVEALTATDAANTTTKNERLETLNTADTAFKALSDTAKTYVFNSTALTSAITELNPAYANRVILLTTAETAIETLQKNTDATQVGTLVTAATNAVSAYTTVVVPNSATALATDVKGFADIALYEAAAPTITAIAAIEDAVADEKEAKVTAARNLYDGITVEGAQAKVFNYSVLTTAEGGIAQAIADAKTAAEGAIKAIGDAKTATELVAAITLAEGKHTAYTALTDDISNEYLMLHMEVEYANEAKTIVTQIAALTAASTKEAVEAVRAEFKAVSENIQKYVVNIKELEALEEAIKDTEAGAAEAEQNQKDEAAVTDFETKFETLTKATAAGFEAAFTAANSAYSALDDDLKAAVTIENAAGKLANYKAALSVVKEIITIGDITALTTADITALEAKVTPARTNYTALALAAKLLVVNLSDLTAAEQELATLKTEKAAADKVNADQAIADVVIAKINELEDMDIDSAAYEEAVKDARAAYKALALKHKLLVTNLAKLVEHEQNI